MINFIGHDRIRGATCLEIGCGWEPILPLLFSLAGAERVIMTDLNPLLTAETFEGGLDAVRRNRERVSSTLDVPLTHEALSWTPANGLENGLERFRLQYLAPCDCTRLPVPAASVDIIYSRDTLEHVPRAVIERILAESRRVLRPAGLVCHLVDPSDHWSHADQSISRVNFLKFSDSVYGLVHLTNKLNYHNRLRHSEYVALMNRAGFELLREERNVDQRSFLEISSGKIKVAPRWRSFDAEDLATIDSVLLARAATPAGPGQR